MHLLLPLAFLTCFACSLLVGRLFLSGQSTYLFLVWNLFLAWIPYGASLGADRLREWYPERWGLLLVLGAVWMAFFPNAPYLVTDFVHLETRPPIPLWYDVGLLAAFAWTGLFLGVYSLRHMHRIVQSVAGTKSGWAFVVATTGLSGLGIYLGRFLRWNSWDLVVHPDQVGLDVLRRMADPVAHPRAVGVTLLFAVFLFGCYLTITSASAPAPRQVVEGD